MNRNRRSINGHVTGSIRDSTNQRYVMFDRIIAYLSVNLLLERERERERVKERESESEREGERDDEKKKIR